MRPFTVHDPDAGDPTNFIMTCVRERRFRPNNLDAILRDYDIISSRYKAWHSEPGQYDGYRKISAIRTGENVEIVAVDDEGRPIWEMFSDTEGHLTSHVIEEFIKGSKKFTRKPRFDGDTEIGRHPDGMTFFHGSSWARGTIETISHKRSDAFGLNPDRDTKDSRNSCSRKMAKLLFEIVRLRARRNVLGAMASVRAEIDEEIMRTARRLGRVDVSTMSWMFGNGSRFRSQAATTYPLLINVMMDDPEITEIIDAGRPLEAALAEASDISVPVIRRMRGLTWQMAATSPTYPDLRPFRGVDPNYVPKNRSGFRDLKKAAKDKGKAVFGHNTVPRFDIIPGSPKEIVSVFEKRGPLEVRDAARDVVRRLIGPKKAEMLIVNSDECHMSNWGWEADAIAAVIRMVGIKSIGKFSDRWHDEMPRVNASVASSKENITWSPILGDHEDGKFLAREITSEYEMVRIGDQQNHCVGSYFYDVIRSKDDEAGMVLIWTLQKAGKIVSTIEIFLIRDENGSYLASVIQEQRSNKREPSKEARRAAARLAERLTKHANENRLAVQRYVSGLTQGKIAIATSKTSPEVSAKLLSLLPGKMSIDTVIENFDKHMAAIRDENRHGDEGDYCRP